MIDTLPQEKEENGERNMMGSKRKERADKMSQSEEKEEEEEVEEEREKGEGEEKNKKLEE